MEGVWKGAMPTSVMPKGVEHLSACISNGITPRMPTSVMPKGVEHPEQVIRQRCLAHMPTSVMPKGVEHFEVRRIASRTISCPPL